VFYCGNYLLNFEMMIIATDFTRVPYSNLDTNVLARHWRSYIVYHNRVKEMISWREKHEPTAKLTSLLSLLMVPGQLLEAARPEDKIFALYGICKRLGYELPAPDYQKPLAVVYTEAAKAVLHYDQSLELLSGVVESSAWADGLPSWVPNLSGCMTRWSRSSLPQLVASPPRESLKSLGLPKCEYLLDLDSTGLKVKGRRLDRICAVGKPWTLEANTTMLGGSAKNQAQYVDSLIGCIGSWLAVITGHNDSPTGKATIEHMARVLTNNLRDEYPAVPFDDMVRFLAILIGMSSSENDMRFALLASLPGGSLNPSQAEITGLIAGCHRVITRIYGSIWQTMFRTVRHYVGMGPHSLKVGDIVVLLHGCATAGVVRPSTGGFRYVGPAYVDGIMDMDFWNSGSESDDEWFTLI
jgi:hypothetical protein